MRRRIAIYGKGGIGKSTISSNLSAALSENGVKVLQIGCDPKHDSTRLLTGDARCGTVLEYLRDNKPEDRKLEDIVSIGYNDTLCVEAGGPEPGVGCAGRGIISAFDLLSDLGVDSLDFDITLYDVLGDVVCGGFAVPIRNEYADTVYIVTSGEFMSIYAANNILRGVSNYDSNRIGGIIFNSRGDDFEEKRVEKFSTSVGIPIIAKICRSELFLEAEKECKTVVELYPDSDVTKTFMELADKILKGKRYKANYLPEDMLEKVVLDRENRPSAPQCKKSIAPIAEKPKIYSSKSVNNHGILHGCAFSGACSVTLSIEGMTTIMHSSRNCAQFAFQLASNSVKRSHRCNKKPSQGFVDPDVVCTSMDEKTMIFGGTDLVRNEIEKQLSKGKRYISVLTGCPPGIIGDDVKGAVQEMSSKYPGSKIVLLEEDGNLNGDHMQGLIDACIEITSSLAKKGLEKKDVVNIVGIKPMATNTIDNLDVISDLLKSIGVGIGCKFLGDCSVTDIENMTSAGLSLLITEDQFAEKQKAFLSDNYDMKFSNNPIGTGIVSTKLWMREVGEVFGRKDEAESAIDSITAEYNRRLEPLKNEFSGKTAYVISFHMNIDWLIDVIEDLGMIPVRLLVVERPDHTYDSDMKVRHSSIEIVKSRDTESIRKDIEEKNPDIIMNTYFSDIGGEDRLQFKIPLVPDVGPFGGLDIMERWIRSSKRPKTEGWKKDAL